MLRINVNKSATAAKKYYSEKYYSEGKSVQSYYSEKDETIGIWGGKAAIKLGLDNDINKNDFASLCDNQFPNNNEQLTERKNVERRVGYDFTFNAPKSISLAYTFGSEEDKKQILEAFRQSVKDTMTEVETGMQTRVRIKGQNENRDTGNIVYGEFVHFTSRPVDSVPDPHLHAHCFVFNATFDETEQKWKAGEFGQIKKDAPYYEAVFHANLANKLQEAGYSIERTEKGFEIKGISRETIEKFSLRTEEIEHLANEKNITDKKQKSGLGARTRESKRKSISEDEQQKNWQERLTRGELKQLQNLKNVAFANEKKKENDLAAFKAVEFSLNHHLERKSVVTDKEILTTAIKSSLGKTSPERIREAFDQNKSIISVKENNQIFITTKEALAEENSLIAKAYAMKGIFKPINEVSDPVTPNLTDEQKKAIKYALTTTDGITIIAGKAGTGKTTLMKEVQRGIRIADKKIFAFAPSAEASRVVQRKEGFKNAETVAKLIQNETMQKSVRNSIVWIDEAGMLSNKDLNRVLDIVKKQNARLILTGDTKQHNSVERGDALRILQQEAGIVPIQVNRIQRQKNEQYKEAVFALSKSDIDKGFQKLDKIGAIHEIEDGKERIEKIADDYFVSVYGKKGNQPPREVLVISPTHIEGDKVTEKIREKLKEGNILAKQERRFRIFKNLQLTAAEKQKTESYIKGNWVVFHQNIKGFKAGSRYEITGTGKDRMYVHLRVSPNKVEPLSLDYVSRFNVFEQKDIFLSKGDKIRITGNGKANDGKHLFNGITYNIAGFDRHGNIKLSNGSVLSRQYRHFTLGYVLTSHASQGKTVDKVIISQSSMSFRASSQEQFYVSVSRGRQAVSIYTDDKTDLLHAVSQSGERKSAIELTKQKKIMNRVIEVNRKGMMQKIKDKAIAAAMKVKSSVIKKDMTHELPGKN